ncbi:endonuclease III [Candidatus Bathyarchaeota archaeon]|nr:MAG: endonuclease III [Candidatus Bathyarchaeota archaeon]
MSGRLQRMQQIISLLREHYGDEPRQGDEKPDPFKTLIGCVLSQRTRDRNAVKAAEALFKAAERPEDVLRLGGDRLRRLIRCLGFYNQKSRYITGICEALLKEFGGRVPDKREQLLKLPGVGPKTADVVLSYAFNRPAIAVDVHVGTVAKRLGLVDDGAAPEAVKKTLEALVPPEECRLVDRGFVRLGKEYCRSRAPRCRECFLNSLCDYPEHGRGEGRSARTLRA